MGYDPEIHRRRSIRLKGYDYSRTGAYFVTICAHSRECLFGEIVDGGMRLNDAGLIARQCWIEIPVHFPQVKLDEFVVMPNHIHGILVITDPGEANATVGAKNFSPLRQPPQRVSPLRQPPQRVLPLRQPPQRVLPLRQPPRMASTPQHPSGTSRTVGSIVRGFKIGVTKWMRNNTPICNVWQRNYYERIIRDDRELAAIREYIANNPAQWGLDKNNPENHKDG
ncbi:transposase [Desulfuromonas versatilis]|nr:transposase [Desulfuromonas versatilis]